MPVSVLYFIQNNIVNKIELTASERASSCKACNLSANSVYRILNHPLKLGDLKNLLYKPTQSPLTPEVSCGPAVSSEAKKSSGLNGNGVGAACEL